MTTYFDNLSSEISRLSRILGEAEGNVEVQEALDKLDEKLVWDMSLCTEFKTFPPKIREAIHKQILFYSLNGQPQYSKYADYADLREQLEGMRALVSNLHDLFHDLAHHPDWRFGDGPLAPLRDLWADAAELREKLAKDAGMLMQAPKDDE